MFKNYGQFAAFGVAKVYPLVSPGGSRRLFSQGYRERGRSKAWTAPPAVRAPAPATFGSPLVGCSVPSSQSTVCKHSSTQAQVGITAKQLVDKVSEQMSINKSIMQNTVLNYSWRVFCFKNN